MKFMTLPDACGLSDVLTYTDSFCSKILWLCCHPHSLSVSYLVLFYSWFTLFANWFLSEPCHWNHTKNLSRSLRELRGNDHPPLGKVYEQTITNLCVWPWSPWKGEEKTAEAGNVTGLYMFCPYASVGTNFHLRVGSWDFPTWNIVASMVITPES